MSTPDGKRRPTIGVSSDWVAGGYTKKMTHALTQAAKKYGANAVTFDFGVRIWEMLSAPQIDAVALCVLGESRMRPELRLNERLPNRPKVAIGHGWGDVPLVQADNAHAVGKAVQHLHLFHGRHRFAFLRGARWNDDAQAREQGFRAALAELGLPCDEELMGDGDFVRDVARQTVRNWLSFGLGFDAIVAANDQMALGAIEALIEGGIRIPRDVSIIGFDDVDEAELVTPPLTTLRQDLQAQADRAVEVLLEQLDGKVVAPLHRIHCDLVTRRSCGCPHYGDARTPTLAPAGASASSRPPPAHAELELTRVATPQARKPQVWAEELSQELTSAAARGGGELVDALDSAREQLGGSSTRWSNAVTALLRKVDCDERELLDLWRSAGSWLGHLRGLEQGALRVEVERLAVQLASLGEATAESADEAALAAAIARYLPGFGFPSAYVALFNDPDLRELGTARLALAYRDGRRLETSAAPFHARDILPRAFVQDLKARNFIVETLGVHDSVFGVLLLELGPDPGLVYTLMRQAVSSALQSIRLHAQLYEEERRREALERKRLERELEIAAHLQTSILPRDPRAPGLEIAATMLPASEVGGDYYDVLPTSDGCWLGIGDVAGHGLTTGVVMLMIQSLVAGLVHRDPAGSPSSILTSLNPVLYSTVRKRLRRDEHATLSLLRYERSGRVCFSGAHEEMLVWRAARQEVERIDTHGAWVGATSDISDALEDEEFTLEPGDVLLLYTDGATEAENARGEQYGLERLERALAQRASLDVRSLCRELLDEVRGYMAQQSDDVTFVVARYVGG